MPLTPYQSVRISAIGPRLPELEKAFRREFPGTFRTRSGIKLLMNHCKYTPKTAENYFGSLIAQWVEDGKLQKVRHGLYCFVKA